MHVYACVCMCVCINFEGSACEPLRFPNPTERGRERRKKERQRVGGVCWRERVCGREWAAYESLCFPHKLPPTFRYGVPQSRRCTDLICLILLTTAHQRSFIMEDPQTSSDVSSCFPDPRRERERERGREMERERRREREYERERQRERKNMRVKETTCMNFKSACKPSQFPGPCVCA